MSTLDFGPIVDLIRKESREAVDDALRDAQDRALTIQEESHRRADEAMRETLREAHAEGERLSGRLARMASMEGKRAVLAARQGLIREAVSAALTRLRALPAGQVESVMLDMIVISARGDEHITPGDVNAAFYTPAFIDKANAALKAAGKPGTLKDGGGSAPGVCGLILHGEGSSTHCTFEALVDCRREDLEALAASILFPAQQG